LISGQGTVNKRIVKSRVGTTPSSWTIRTMWAGITIVEQDGHNKITINSQSNKITIEARVILSSSRPVA